MVKHFNADLLNADAISININTFYINADAISINADINSVRAVTLKEGFSTLLLYTSIVWVT